MTAPWRLRDANFSGGCADGTALLLERTIEHVLHDVVTKLDVRSRSHAIASPSAKA